MIYGGNKHFIAKVTATLKQTFGAYDKVHATPSMGVFAGNLALAVVDPKLFQKSMNYYKWMFILSRSPDAGFIRQPMHIHRASGEGALGKWWRTAAAIILLNAGKRNLAITGKKEYLTQKFSSSQVSSSYATYIFAKVKNDWTVAELDLGKSCPKELKQAAAELRALKNDRNIEQELFSIISENAMKICQKIAQDKTIANQQKSDSINLITGTEIRVEINKNNLSIKSYLPFTYLYHINARGVKSFVEKNAALQGEIAVIFKNQTYNFKLNSENDKYKYLYQLSLGFLQSKGKVPVEEQKIDLPCTIKLNVFGFNN